MPASERHEAGTSFREEGKTNGSSMRGQKACQGGQGEPFQRASQQAMPTSGEEIVSFSPRPVLRGKRPAYGSGRNQLRRHRIAAYSGAFFSQTYISRCSTCLMISRLSFSVSRIKAYGSPRKTRRTGARLPLRQPQVLAWRPSLMPEVPGDRATNVATARGRSSISQRSDS